MKLDFDAMFAAHVAATQKEWAHDRRESMGASEIFACLRRGWFKKRAHEFGDKYPEDANQDDNWGAARRGDLLEAHYVVPAISEQLPVGALVWAGKAQKTLFHGKNSGTPDGLVIDQDKDALALYGVEDLESDCFVFEIKSIDPRVRLETAKSIHRGQAQTQLGLIREKTKYKPVYAVILYVDASFLDKIKPFVVKFEPNAWRSAQVRADLIFSENDPAKIEAEGKLDGECDTCPFTRSCAFVTTGAMPDDNSKLANKDDNLLAVFDALIDEYKQAKADSEEASHDFEVIKARLKEMLTETHTRKIGGKKAKRDWSVSWYSQNGQMRLSTRLLKEALGDDLDAYKEEGNPFDVLRVTFSDEKS